jgi:hypothetical protein
MPKIQAEYEDSSMKLLWTNTGSSTTFLSQDVTLNSNDYDLLLIVFTSVNSADVSTIIRKGKYGHLETIGVGSTQTVLRVREVDYVNATKLKFGSGYKITLAPSSSISARTQDDAMCIPMAIYGIKL